MTTITLNCRLEVIHPLPQGERLFVQFHWSRDVPSNEPSFYNVYAPANEPFVVDLVRVPNQPHLPRTLNLRLFSVADHDNTGVTTELMVASSSIPTLALAKRSVTDFDNTDGNLQARLTLEWDNPNLQELKRIPGDYHDPTHQQLSQQLITLCKSQYQQRKFRFDREHQVFFSVSTDNGHLPLVCFPLLATISAPLIDENVRFFLHSAWVACRLRGHDYQRMSELSPGELLEVINEMLTIVSKCIVYTSDRTRSSATKPLFTEQWERVSLFPHRSLAGYDCEDIAQQIQELAHPLRSMKLPPALNPITSLLKKMTVFTVEGDLDVDGRGSMTPHCYVVIVDADYVDYLLGRDRKRRSSYIPTLVVEGTSWSEGTITSDRTFTKQLKRCLSRSPLADVVKVHTPFRASGYGLVAQMQTADHRNGEMLSLALVRDSIMGVPLNDWMEHTVEPDDVQVWTRTPSSDRPKIEAEMLEMPLSNIPRWNDEATRKETGRPRECGQEQLVMRWIDWENHEDELRGLLPDTINIQRIDVTVDQCAFALITLL